MVHRIMRLALVFAVAGCMPLNLTPRVTRWYRTVNMVTQTPAAAHWVDVSAFVLPVPDSGAAPRNIFSLAGEGQGAYIQAMAARTQGGADLTRAIAGSIAEPSGLSPYADVTLVRRRVVFSVENRSPVPADRIESVRLQLTRLTGGARFEGWDKLVTAFQTIDLGSLTFTQKRDVSAELGLTLPAALLGAAPTVRSSSGSQLEEQQTLKDRVVMVNGVLRPDSAVLLEQGGLGLDLTGNLATDFLIRMTRSQGAQITRVTHPRMATGGVDCGTKPVFQRQAVKFPTDTVPVRANLVLTYRFRHVKTGDQTVQEGDDDVDLVEVTQDLGPIELIPAQALTVRVFRLESGGGTLSEFRSATSAPVLEFATYDDAARMANWIGTCGASTVSGFRLSVDRTPIPDSAKPEFIISTVVKNVSP